jgi:uncharacterized protein (TIGR02453 family)
MSWKKPQPMSKILSIMISKATLDFLTKLGKNNNREWFEKNRAQYEAAKADVEACVEKIIPAIRKFDKRIGDDITAKKSLFRIYRDVRFSGDKRPYKTNMGAYVSPGGKKTIAPGYYIHIEPGKAFLAGGMWMPPAPELGKIRQEIDYNLDEFKKILKAKSFKDCFGDLDQEDTLATAPKGYPKDHPGIDILKLKSFVAITGLSDKEVLSKDFVKTVEKTFKAMKPLNDFLQRAID